MNEARANRILAALKEQGVAHYRSNVYLLPYRHFHGSYRAFLCTAFKG